MQYVPGASASKKMFLQISDIRERWHKEKSCPNPAA